MENIRMIEIEKIHNHPDNPRKDVGDVSELAESIKHSGIMQNLTVVPFCDEYRVIIGHRRLAASKLAGLKEVPCAVVEMSEKEQIATMLSENMQRVDLTVVEQAQGVQMLFDLGESVAAISEKTGFSESTVRKRMKVATLPADKLKEAEKRGGTLEEYIKCCEIENEKERKKLLEAAGTRDFNWKYESAIKEQKLKKNIPLIKKEIKKLAKEISSEDRWTSKYDSHSSINIVKWKPGDKLIKGYKEGQEYFWSISYGTLYISVKSQKVKSATPKKSKKEIEAERRRKELKKLFEKAHKMRVDFILNFSAAKKFEKIITEYLIRFNFAEVIYYRNSDDNIFNKAMGDNSNGKYYQRPDAEKFNQWTKEKSSYALLILAYVKSGDSSSASCYEGKWGEMYPEYKKSNLLELLYEFLAELGYQISTEEEQLINGTHELYAQIESEDKND
ncbi:MAG: ParB/RepB/Spo0J family partition protein [Clostridia bacterium]|nr:ParB/RepB/Spo0J family partition protein [Clostridia bacterium]